jgi:hypothetical protein
MTANQHYDVIMIIGPGAGGETLVYVRRRPAGGSFCNRSKTTGRIDGLTSEDSAMEEKEK